jgi:putative intracellular protease/amidase
LHSIESQFMTEEDMAVFDDPSHKLNQMLRELKKPSAIRPEEYGMFFASAGFASVYGYPTARGLQAIAEDVWARGGIVSTVCHGGAILLGVKDAATGKSIIAGLKVTGFPTEGERLAGVLGRIEQDGVQTIENNAAEAGASYVARPSLLSIACKHARKVVAAIRRAATCVLAPIARGLRAKTTA